MGTVEIPLFARRQAVGQKIQLIQDAVGVMVLVPAAMARLKSATVSHLALGIAEIIAIGLALGSAATELKPQKNDTPEVHHGFDKSDLYVGIVLFAEWGFALSAGHKWFTPTFLTACACVFLAFFRARLRQIKAGRRKLVIDDNGVDFRPRRGAFKLAWNEIQRIEEAPDALLFHAADGATHRMRVSLYVNAEEIRRAVLSAKALPQAGI